MFKELIIIIPHYNNPKGLYASINSISEKLKVDIIIIDDGSQEEINIKQIKSEYKLGTIFYKKNGLNKGIAKTLNIGLNFAQNNKYKYIARLDAGDLFYKNKLTIQHKYLEQNPDVKLLGTWGSIVDSNGNHMYNLKHPTSYKEIKKAMHLNSVFIHPSVMFSSVILKEIVEYPTNYFAAEDYAFFFSVINKFKAENYPEILIDYFADPRSISSIHRKKQVKNRIKIMIKNFYFGLYPIYGIFRSLALLFFSRDLLNVIKSKSYK